MGVPVVTTVAVQAGGDTALRERLADRANWPSAGGAAGLCDESGRIFGLMPHPEAYLDPENHPRWRAQAAAGELPPVGLGLHVLAGGVRAVIEGR